ncbi:hypothetical protein COCVIDRAFT_97148 [Bipolaris victoriae FI3]|uniref:Zn(2)-C6 fungal-type domain-containing protein n=1 Tax=Bipolaris victoriae (strain FI3) TaxID=930091 RepID=W7EP28_BIPV3|nr:hypothetical protein COCVIDRAFT_97148 [Bipolaris victoriae FI3]
MSTMSDARRPSQDSPNPNQPSRTANGPSPGTAPTPTPNPRSCITCRRRKVKCDKKNPCSHCVRAKIDCVFPGPGRAPRKSRKPPDAELLERLRRLEGVVTSLNAQVEGHDSNSSTSNNNDNAADRQREPTAAAAAQDQCPLGITTTTSTAPSDDSLQGLEARFGRLVVENGRSRYINNSFWASLNNEVENLKSILMEPSDDEDDAHTPESSEPSSQHHSFIFGYSSSNVDMQALHPPEHHVRQFWNIYKENVEPLVKVLHVPTFELTIMNAAANIEKVSKRLEAWLFVIYYGAVTSITPAECRDMFGEERSTLLTRFCFGIEQALARANFLYCDEILILQAFVVYLVLLRRNDDARKIWPLTGLVVRIAQTLGIHRDGTHFDLPPFEVEMRRRLWWQVCILDARSAEDQGCDPSIHETLFDTKMPLNVNDSDIHPGMIEFPQGRQGFTDMTFCLLRFEIANIMRRIIYVPPGPNRCTQFLTNLTVEQKEKWITGCHQAIEEKYLKDCDMTIPLCWVTATVSRLIMSKMWLIVYHPHQRKDGGATLSQEIRDKLFVTSLENIEYGLLLETEARTMKWGWLFKTYVQWHAIAFLLSELCVRTKGEAVDRAWRALETCATRWWFPFSEDEPQRKAHHSHIWKPLAKLLEKAKLARERQLALEQAISSFQNRPFTSDTFDLKSPEALQQTDRTSFTSPQQNSQTLDNMLRPVAPKLGAIPGTQQPSWPNGMDIQRPLPDEPATGFRDGAQDLSNSAQAFRNISAYGLDDVINDAMAGTLLDFPSYVQGTVSTSGAAHPNLSQTSQSLSAAEAFATNNAPTAANGYRTFGDGMLPNTTMGFDMNSNGGRGMTSIRGATNGQEMNENDIMDNGDVDWPLWDDMVNQLEADNHIANASTRTGPGTLGMVPWF